MKLKEAISLLLKEEIIDDSTDIRVYACLPYLFVDFKTNKFHANLRRFFQLGYQGFEYACIANKSENTIYEGDWYKFSELDCMGHHYDDDPKLIRLTDRMIFYVIANPHDLACIYGLIDPKDEGCYLIKTYGQVCSELNAKVKKND